MPSKADTFIIENTTEGRIRLPVRKPGQKNPKLLKLGTPRDKVFADKREQWPHAVKVSGEVLELLRSNIGFKGMEEMGQIKVRAA